MCDYSLQAFKSRPAQVGEDLKTHRFGTGSGGFIGADGNDTVTAVCVLPGTELAFKDDVTIAFTMFADKVEGRTARFRQTALDNPYAHHDALEFADGRVIELNRLASGLTATVLQLPAAPKTAEEAKEQQRLEVVA